MPAKSIKGWLMFTASVLAVLFVVNNVTFLQGIIAKR